MLDTQGRRSRRRTWSTRIVAGGLLVGSLVAGAATSPATAAPAGSVAVAAQASVASAARTAVAAAAERGGALGGAGRRALAEAVAAAAEVDPAPVVAAWEAATPVQAAVAAAALAQVGVRYRSRGSDPSEGFDCSGLTSWAWSQAGVRLGRSSWEQLADRGHRLAEAQVGDLVGYPGHVMLYVGGGAVVHSPYTGRTVEVIPLRRYVDRFVTPAYDDLPARNESVMTRVRAF